MKKGEKVLSILLILTILFCGLVFCSQQALAVDYYVYEQTIHLGTIEVTNEMNDNPEEIDNHSSHESNDRNPADTQQQTEQHPAEEPNQQHADTEQYEQYEYYEETWAYEYIEE